MRPPGLHRFVALAVALACPAAGRCGTRPLLVLDGMPWRVINAADTKVDLAFYDAAEKGDFVAGICSAEAFAAEALTHGVQVSGVRSEADIRHYFKSHPGVSGSIGFFGHGTAEGLYLNRQLVSDFTVRSLVRHLRPGGTLSLYCCSLAEGSVGPRYARLLTKGQTLWLHWGQLGAVAEFPPWRYTGGLHTLDASEDQLWMLSYTR